MPRRDDDLFDEDDDMPRPSKGGFPVWAIVLLCALPVVAVVVIGGAFAMFAMSRTADVRRNEAQVQIAADRVMVVDQPAAAREGKGPSKKTQESVKTLKAELTKFEVVISWNYPPPLGGADAGTTHVELVTNPKKAAANPEQVFLITEKQAAALIDYLAESGLFDRVSVDPAGVLGPGWYVEVMGGPAAARIGYWRWRFNKDVKPATVGVIQYLTKSLDGEAKAALERFHYDGDKSKR
jgi:hypothetical protein